MVYPQLELNSYGATTFGPNVQNGLRCGSSFRVLRAASDIQLVCVVSWGGRFREGRGSSRNGYGQRQQCNGNGAPANLAVPILVANPLAPQAPAEARHWWRPNGPQTPHQVHQPCAIRSECAKGWRAREEEGDMEGWVVGLLFLCHAHPLKPISKAAPKNKNAERDHCMAPPRKIKPQSRAIRPPQK